MKLLNYIWPWSAILRAQRETENERFWRSQVENFVSQCLAYIDHLEPGLHHIRLNNMLYCIGVDHCVKMALTIPKRNVGCVAPGTEDEL